MDKIQNQLELILKGIDEKNGVDTTVLDVKEQTSIADYFVITTGNSSTQVSAIADGIDELMEENGYSKINRSGYSSARWVLLDYGSIIVHIFHKEEREYYNLERLWEEFDEELKEDN